MSPFSGLRAEHIAGLQLILWLNQLLVWWRYESERTRHKTKCV